MTISVGFLADAVSSVEIGEPDGSGNVRAVVIKFRSGASISILYPSVEAAALIKQALEIENAKVTIREPEAVS